MEKPALVQLRIPRELHRWVIQWAKENHRSMNGQILAKLDEIRQEQNETVTPPVPSKDKAA